MNLKAISLGKNVPDDVNVVIEVPIGGEPIKYEIDKDAGALVVDRFLYTSMRYPGNYGFIPHTLSDDGDPCDVLIANHRAIIPGALIAVRPVGVLRMQDEAGGDEQQAASLLDLVMGPGQTTGGGFLAGGPPLEPAARPAADEVGGVVAELLLEAHVPAVHPRVRQVVGRHQVRPVQRERGVLVERHRENVGHAAADERAFISTSLRSSRLSLRPSLASRCSVSLLIVSARTTLYALARTASSKASAHMSA